MFQWPTDVVDVEGPFLRWYNDVRFAWWQRGINAASACWADGAVQRRTSTAVGFSVRLAGWFWKLNSNITASLHHSQYGHNACEEWRRKKWQRKQQQRRTTVTIQYPESSHHQDFPIAGCGHICNRYLRTDIAGSVLWGRGLTISCRTEFGAVWWCVGTQDFWR
jgi:hypothetical protein